jgi:hypothetical protein
MTSLGRRLGFGLAACAFSAPIQAGSLTFTHENDLFSNHDRRYTSGIQLAWMPKAPPPDWLRSLGEAMPLFSQQAQFRYGYTLGQAMFTASDIRQTHPPLDDRPYAGWLYTGASIIGEYENNLAMLSLTLGIVGPASLAAETQSWLHQQIGSEQPKGWGTQLHNEPGLNLSYFRSWRRWVTTTFIGNELDFTPHIGASLGNVLTSAKTGLTLRYGQNLPNDYGVPRIQPGLPTASQFSISKGFAWYLFAGAEGRAVARNIFLDGNSFGQSRRVNKMPFVGDIQFGLAIQWTQFRLSYTHVFQSKEYETQAQNDSFGGITLSFRY